MTYRYGPGAGYDATLPYQAVQLNLYGQNFTVGGEIPLAPPELSALGPFATRLSSGGTQGLFVIPTGTGLYLSAVFAPIVVGAPSTYAFVDLELTSLRAVPEPNALPLFALVALGALRRICKVQECELRERA